MYEFWQRVLGVADSIRAGKFSPDPEENKCRWCDYRNICPVFTGKEYNGSNSGNIKKPSPAVGSAAVAPSFVKTDSERLADKIDQLGATLEEEKKLRQEIISEMKKLNFKCHFGSKFRAEVTEKSAIEFTDKEKTVRFLRSSNLLSKTLVPTQSTIVDLLADPSVSETDKKKLRALMQERTVTDLNITEEK